MRLLLEMAFVHLLHRKRQTLVSVFGVATGVGFFIAIAAMMQGFQKDFVTRVIDVAPHITIKDEYRLPSPQPALLTYPEATVQVRGVKPRDPVRGLRGGMGILDALSRMPGMAAAPTLRGQAILRYGGKDVSGSVVGIDPVRERLVTNLERDIKLGKLDDLSTTGNGIILGWGLANKLGVEVGDTLTAVAPAGVVMRLKVVGIFESGIVTLDNVESYVLLKKAQILQNRPRVINQIRMRLTDVTRSMATAADIERRWGYRTEPWEEAQKNVLGIFVIQNGIMYSTTGAILVVACFGIFNIISTVVYEKTKDIAILKSMGFPERDIRRLFLIQGTVLGVAGSLAGWALGFGLTEALGALRFNIEGFIRAQQFILDRSFINYAVAGAISVLAASFAAYLPARKAARVDPVDIVRGAA